MTITATVVADSISLDGHRITTLSLRYPRIIHAEFLTHRVFSRNASSSRAIPIERMIQDVIDDCAMPVSWGANQKGMQAGEECTNQITLPIWMCVSSPSDPVGESVKDKFLFEKQEFLFSAKDAWERARDHAVDVALAFCKAGYHKQIANRLLEPFGHISVVVTATEWQNFFDLRCHPDADPTMRALAEAMREARNASVPYKPEPGEWRELHLPYFTDEDGGELATGGYDADDKMFTDAAMMISAARCARVSYLNHDGTNPDIKKDLALAAKLLESKHMSPFEHQARAGDDTELWGNFRMWEQHRKMIEVHQ